MKKLISIAFAVLLAGVGSAGAEPYPSRPITIVVPAAAGGSIDTVVRIMAPRMRASLDQPIIVEDVAGASGIIGLGRVSRAAPDGYTITVVAFDHVISGAGTCLRRVVSEGDGHTLSIRTLSRRRSGRAGLGGRTD